jgi:amidase
LSDNAILIQAMLGKDNTDKASYDVNKDNFNSEIISKGSLKGKRLGVLTALLTDSIYAATIKKLKKAGAELIEIAPQQPSFNGFITLLNIDMKHDLPKYLTDNKIASVSIKNVKDVILFNKQDSLQRAPYGQQLFEGIVKDTTTLAQLEIVKQNLKLDGENYLKALKEQNLDAILSINNYHSGIAAVSFHPTLTVPMGYKKSGEPISLTFVGVPFSEDKLLSLGYAYEQLTKARKIPKNYQ